MKNVFFLSLSFLWVSAFAQLSPKQINQSPYNVVYGHLYYLQADSYNANLAALSLTEVKSRKKLAVQLKQVLDGKGLFINLDDLPQDPNYTDSLSGKQKYQLHKSMPALYVHKIGGSWYYSKETIAHIPKWYKEIYPLGGSLKHYFSAAFWHHSFLGMSLWQWLLLVSSILITILFARIVQFIFKAMLKGWIKSILKLSEDLDNMMISLVKPLALMLGIFSFLWFLPTIQIPVVANAFIIKGLRVANAVLLLLVALAILKLVFYYLYQLAERTESTLDDQLYPVLNKLAQIILWSLGVVYILSVIGVNITALLAGISIGGLALALAAQDTVKNFFGSIMIFLDKPFQIGDWIHFDGVDGTVEQVGIRSTRIRTFANSITYVPNSKLADSIVDNMGLRVYRRFKTDIGVTYDTPPDMVNLFVEGIREIIRLHPSTRKDYYEVHLNSFGASSVNVLLYVFFEAPTWTDELKGRHKLLHSIMVLAHEMGVRFAFPTQTLHVEELPNLGLSNTPSPKKQSQAIKDYKEALMIVKESLTKDHSVDSGKIKPIGGE